MKYIKFKNYSNTFVFDTGIKGKNITIFGGIHGNEIAGIKVIDKIVKELENGDLFLLKGKLILAYGNEKAIKIGKKEYKYNLNRLFKKEYLEKKSNEYENKRAKELMQIMLKSDLLLDIHSVSSDSEAFMFCENIEKDLKIVSNFYSGKIILGWGDISGDLIGGDTDSYMHSIGKRAFTLECGNHNSNNAFKIGYNTVLRLLQKYGLTKIQSKYTCKRNIFYKMYKIETTKTGNFKFNSNISNFKSIKKGELIGIDGINKIIAKENFIILLPNYEKTKIGEEIFYYGEKLN